MSLWDAIAIIVNYYFRHSWLNFFDENTIIVDKVKLLRWFGRRSEDPLLTALVQNNATISTMYIVTLVAQTFHTTLPRVQTNSKGPCIAWHRRCAVRSSLKSSHCGHLLRALTAFLPRGKTNDTYWRCSQKSWYATRVKLKTAANIGNLHAGLV